VTSDLAPAPRASLAARFRIYQAERFPFATYAPLITCFVFSSAAYSRLARGAPGFVPWPIFLLGTYTALVFFFLLRVLDEHKDADVDLRFRPELPVPRGLVTLTELRWIGGTLFVIALALNALFAPVLLWAMLVVAAWATLMTKEFFVRDWLRAQPTAYLVTHMAIMPMIDSYTTGLDWLREGVRAPHGLVLFLVVTFFNGCLIEIGRKIRPPALERTGVDTYTKAWGVVVAPAIWLGVLIGAATIAWLAARHTGAGLGTAALLVALATGAAVPTIAFLRTRGEGWARRIELVSGLWPIATYLVLGGGPFVARWLQGWGR
jgi:4-hydroxybenzoate polyprenyltransferase